jgi:hypothetical protein
MSGALFPELVQETVTLQKMRQENNEKKKFK